MPARATEKLSTRELAAWRGFLRAHAALEKELDSELVAAHGLPLSSYEVLRLLADAPEGRMRMCELAESVVLSRSGITRLADRLESEGLIERVTCETDRRGLHAAITAAGRRRLAAARVTHLEGVRRRFLSCFSGRELGELAEFWERVLPGASRR
jgi:DNA-binding MarR family transcriptional regulator